VATISNLSVFYKSICDCTNNIEFFYLNLVCCPPQSEWETATPAPPPPTPAPVAPGPQTPGVAPGSAKLLPEPGSGQCGLGYEDRIFGGTETEVNGIFFLIYIISFEE
jgi:hypothetical protein